MSIVAKRSPILATAVLLLRRLDDVPFAAGYV